MYSRGRAFTLAASAGVMAASAFASGTLVGAPPGTGSRSIGLAAPGTRLATATALKVAQAEFPLQLTVRGDRVRVRYRVRGAQPVTGTLFVRNDRGAFTALPLTARTAASSGELTALVPDRLVEGRRLEYYAVIADSSAGASVTLPAAGAAGPEAVWIINDAGRVDLGRHGLRRPKGPEAVVARAGPTEVGFARDGLVFGPRSFDIARDDSPWLWDSVNSRVLAWAPGHPGVPARTVRLSSSAGDFAAGPAGSFYVLRDGPPGTSYGRLTRLTSRGTALWTSRIARRPPGLATGPGGTLYWTGPPAEDSEEEMARASSGIEPWIPVATPAGRPLPPATQRRRTLWAEPLPGGMRLVRVSAGIDRSAAPHEARVALVDRAGRVVRAWRITSRSEIRTHGGSTLVAGDPVIVLAARDYLVLRLGPSGRLRSGFALPRNDPPRSAYGDGVVTDIRVAPDGRVYQLGSAPDFGAAVYRYAPPAR